MSTEPQSVTESASKRSLYVVISLLIVMILVLGCFLAYFFWFSGKETERTGSRDTVNEVTCVYNGDEYAENESFESTDGCNTCSCTEGDVVCTLMACGSVGLWKECNPDLANCATGLVCNYYRTDATRGDIYMCIQYLNEGDECGRSVAKLCSEGLECVNTGGRRTVCGTFMQDGGQECFEEPMQVCQ